MTYETTLVIGDAHADPDHSNDRFDWLGRFIIANRPDNVVQIGDFGNLDSISFHDHGRPLLKKGRRLSDDIEAMQDAFERIMGPMEDMNGALRRSKKALYRPRMYWLEGNHEDRVFRYILDKPELSGFLPETDMVGAQDRGWTLVPYRSYCYINGTAFTHVPVNHMGRPISGKYATMRAAEHAHHTTVFGHLHRREVLSLNRHAEGSPHGERVDGVCSGCYFDYSPDYIRRNGAEGTLNWWAGLLMLTHVGDSKVDLDYISLERIREDYS